MSLDHHVDMKTVAYTIPPDIVTLGNIDTISMALDDVEKIEKQVIELNEKIKNFPNFIVSSGGGIIDDTPEKNLSVLFDVTSRFPAYNKEQYNQINDLWRMIAANDWDLFNNYISEKNVSNKIINVCRDEACEYLNFQLENNKIDLESYNNRIKAINLTACKNTGLFPLRNNGMRSTMECVKIPQALQSKGTPMEKILIVEDSRVFLNLISKNITGKFGYECVTAGTFEAARQILEEQSDPFLMAVLDLNLPDAPNGEIVELVVSRGIPAIVLTALINDDIRDQIMSQEVFDYIIKEGPQSIGLLTDTIRRYVRNQAIFILVVDDSKVTRSLTRRMLEKQNYQVIESGDGKEALQRLKENPQIRLVITDYQMPAMDGFELTAEIRKKIPKDEMAVIGMSAAGNPVLSAKFLQNGANDFVSKPYHEEEFAWRINQNIEMLENIMKLKDAAIKDHLTGLYNRRYFFNTAEKFYENAKRKNLYIGIGMIDIDHFKTINDTYGHAAGDQVLQHLSQILKSSFRASDIVARYGGEEFIVLTANMVAERYSVHFEQLRKKIAGSPAKTNSGDIQATISAGLTTRLGTSLKDMLKEADDLLYQAKAAGRNRVVVKLSPEGDKSALGSIERR